MRISDWSLDVCSSDLRRLGWRGTPVARFAAEFGASPVAVAALTVTIVLALLATFANFITPQNPYDLAQLDIMDGMLPPGSTDFAGSMTYHLGTDQQGRDMLSAIIFGLRMSLGVGVMSTFIALSLGLLLGVLPAHFGGKVDPVIIQIGSASGRERGFKT